MLSTSNSQAVTTKTVRSPHHYPGRIWKGRLHSGTAIEKLHFRNVFKKPAFSNSIGLKSVFERLHFRDGLVWNKQSCVSRCLIFFPVKQKWIYENWTWLLYAYWRSQFPRLAQFACIFILWVSDWQHILHTFMKYGRQWLFSCPNKVLLEPRHVIGTCQSYNPGGQGAKKCWSILV